MKNYSNYPCPICHKEMFIIGKDNKGYKIGSCGCKFHFKKTRSEKDIDRKFIMTPWGMERVSQVNLTDELQKAPKEIQDAVIAMTKKEGI
jgi:hypothetical protein